jgi:hypothetical protein
LARLAVGGYELSGSDYIHRTGQRDNGVIALLSPPFFEPPP